MEKFNTRQNLTTLLFLTVFGIGIVIRQLNHADGILRLLNGTVQTAVFAGLIIAWCIMVRHRLIQKGIRRHITVLCGWMLLWFLLRGWKYYILPPETAAARYVWYGYYIPMMMMPASALCAVLYIGKKDDWKLPKHWGWSFLMPSLISLLVLTNDLHQLVFTFPADAAVWTDRSYGYGPMYLLTFSWFFLCTAGMLYIMRARCRIPETGSPVMKLPLLPLILGTGYCLLYGFGWLPGFFRDLIIIMCLLTILTFETAIRVGYIRSNSNYLDLFHQSSVDAQIYDRELCLRYRSEQFPPYDREIVRTAVSRGSYADEQTRVASAAIHGGYVVWKEEIADQIRLQKELESANEYLEDRNLLLGRYYETRLQRRKLEEQNRLYDEMQKQTREKQEKLDRLLRQFSESDPEEEPDCLLSLGLITAYLKRRNNLIFLAVDQDMLPVSELKNCITETVRILESFGICCTVHVDVSEPAAFEQMVRLYDAFETAVEETAVFHPVYFVSVTEEENEWFLRIRIAEIDRIPDSLQTVFRAEQQEDGEYLLELRTSEEGCL